MKILIVGLGLIGGSLARALKYFTEHEVYGFDTDGEAVRRAVLVGACDEAWSTMRDLERFDVIVLAAYPRASVDFLKAYGADVPRGAYVFDLGGIKRSVCEVGFAAAEKHGFVFIGAHPMAGTQFSGFEASRESLYKNATMILVPPENIAPEKLDFAVSLFKSVGFGAINVTSAKEHDEIIAYTSQLAHVLSNAYVKSPRAKLHRGYSAGSFRDLTRVAHLNPKMWTELFMDNRDNLIGEVELLAKNLLEYADAMKSGDAERLYALLEGGSRINDEIKGE